MEILVFSTGISLCSISILSLQGRGQFLVLLNNKKRDGNLSLLFLCTISLRQASLPGQLISAFTGPQDHCVNTASKTFWQKNNPRITSLIKSPEVSRRLGQHQDAWGIINTMKHQKLSRSLSLGRWTKLLLMDCLVYIAAAAVLALASKPLLKIDVVF